MKAIYALLATLMVASSCGLLAASSSSSSSSSSASSSSAAAVGVERGSDASTYTFRTLPTTVDQLKSMVGGDLSDPYKTVAFVVVALMRYEQSPADCFEMLDYLNGPNDLSAYEKSFIKERLTGKTYKPRSFCRGATPDNNYTPTTPYKIRVTSNKYSFQQDGWATLYVASGGADNARPVKLRKKASTNEWFYTEIVILSDIRTPASADPWR